MLSPKERVFSHISFAYPAVFTGYTSTHLFCFPQHNGPLGQAPPSSPLRVACQRRGAGEHAAGRGARFGGCQGPVRRPGRRAPAVPGGGGASTQGTEDATAVPCRKMVSFWAVSCREGTPPT